jgi:hypothetical protein
MLQPGLHRSRSLGRIGGTPADLDPASELRPTLPPGGVCILNNIQLSMIGVIPAWRRFDILLCQSRPS